MSDYGEQTETAFRYFAIEGGCDDPGAQHDDAADWFGGGRGTMSERQGLDESGAKERFADRLRQGLDPSLVMAEQRLREVINGSPGRIVQVRHDDLRTLLLAYAELAAGEGR